MMQRRFQDTLSHPKSLAREKHHRQQKIPKKQKINPFFYYYQKIEKLKVETAAQGHSDETCLPQQEGGREEMKERGRPTKLFFLSFIFPL